MNESTTPTTDTYAIVRARLANGLRIGDGDIVQLCDEIERLREEVAGLKIELEGATHNRFYDQRDAYFEGLRDGR